MQATHKRPRALSVHVHRDEREAAHRLARAEDEQRGRETASDEDAVHKERRAVEEEAVCGMGNGEDWERISVVRVEQVGCGGPDGRDHAEQDHSAVFELVR